MQRSFGETLYSMKENMKKLYYLLALVGLNGLFNNLCAMEQPMAHAVRDLFVACNNDKAEQVRSLLAQNIEINVQDELGNTPLHIAARVGAQAAVLLLIEQAVMDIKNAEGKTALYIAAEMGRDDIAKILLNTGARADIKMHNGITALHAAAIMGYGAIVTLLLEEGGADRSLIADGETACEAAAACGHQDIERLFSGIVKLK